MNRIAVASSLLFLAASSLNAQQTLERDPTAITLVTQSVTALGGLPPGDSTATGTVNLVEGSRKESGTVRILTRGTDQSAVELDVPSGARRLTYSKGKASEAGTDGGRSLWLEQAVTSHATDFPLPLLAAALSDPNTGFHYVGQEVMDGAAVYHLRFWQTFPSDANLKHLAALSAHEVWIDAATGLPRKVSYRRRGSVSEDAISVEVFFSDYRSVGGVLYPFLIKKSLNGTPWATIQVENVTFNTGLTDSDFPVQ